MLDGKVTDGLEADALLFQNEYIDIYSASWGPRDNGKTMEAPGQYAKQALENGIKNVSFLSEICKEKYTQFHPTVQMKD